MNRTAYEMPNRGPLWGSCGTRLAQPTLALANTAGQSGSTRKIRACLRSKKS